MFNDLKELSAILAQHANEQNSIAMRAYMKDKFEFYGIKSPLRKELEKPYIKQWSTLDDPDFKSIIADSWSRPEREWQYIAMDALKLYQRKMDESYITFCESLITDKSWWDTVDFLASTIIGGLLRKNPEHRESWIDKWMNSDNMWLERTAILHQLKYGQQTDIDLLSALIDIKKSDKEFFIQKAIGWSLRQYSKFNPLAVTEILESYPELSGLAKREASKYIKQ